MNNTHCKVLNDGNDLKHNYEDLCFKDHEEEFRIPWQLEPAVSYSPVTNC